MKGTLVKTDQGWVVEHKVAEKTPIGYKSWWGTFPLHPEFIEMMNTCFTSKFTQEVEFEFVTEWENGEVGVNGLTYAKLIHHPVDTNKMMDHIGEVNEMVNHVPAVGKMVEDVEKLAEEFYPLNDNLYPNSSLIRKAFTAGYNKAKETLFTKEDVLKAGEIGEINHYDYKHIVSLLDEAKAINQSLKQHKQ
jgi:hypothetical protein